MSDSLRKVSIITPNRRSFIGGSDARIIMGDDEIALARLWREKRGEVEPEDLSGNLIVQLGSVTEDLNRRGYELNSGQVIIDIQRRVRHPAVRWMAATLDGRIEASGAVFEAKFMLPWSFSEEAAAEKYMPQLQHNMWVGAALTYARRYALFTLVGIAGEDDLDAPDLLPPEQQASEPEKPKGNGSLNGGQHQSASPAAARPAPKSRLAPVASAPGPEASAQLRDHLLGQLKELISGDEAALWAHRSLPEKNKLIAADALRVEESFQTKLASFGTSAADEPRSPTEVAQPLTAQNLDPGTERKGRARSKTIDKSVLTLPEPRRVRDREHVRYVAKQPCLVCGRQLSDPHHLRFAQSRAMARKVSDEFTVPLCRGHHREVHRYGDEAAWWEKTGLDPTIAARALWLETHPMATELARLPVGVADPPAGQSTDHMNPERDRRVGRPQSRP